MYSLCSCAEMAPREPTNLPVSRAHARIVAASGPFIGLIGRVPI